MTFMALVPSFYTNVKQYNAKGDGTTDDTSAISAAISAVNTAGGGTVIFPPGTYISGNQTLYPNVHLIGAGLGNTTIRLKAGANTDLFSAQTSSINLSASFGAGSAGTLLSFSIRDLTLDGNKANQSSGTSYPLRFYGYNFTLRDVQVMNGYTGGCLVDWNGGTSLSSPSDQMESLIDSCKFHDNNGIGLQIAGPHDTRLQNVVSFNNGSHNFHFAPNFQNALISNSKSTLCPNTTNVCGFLVEANGCKFSNCIATGSYYCNVALIASNCSWNGGGIVGTSPNWTSVVGMQAGQASGNTPFPGQINQSGGTTTAVKAQYCNVNTQITECRGGGLSCPNEQYNLIFANIYQTAGTSGIVSDMINPLDTYIILVSGLTTTNSIGTAGGMNISANTGNYAFTVNDVTNGQVFRIPSGSGSIYQNGAVNTAEGIYFSASTTANSLANNGTINIQGFPNYVVAPTSNVSGIIMQAGYGGQMSALANASNFSIQFASSGSNVANGASEVIPPNSMRWYWYDGGNSLWYGITSVGEQSASAASVASSGTITTAGVDQARVTTSGAVTGVILQAGTYANQACVVVNESANTITFAAVGTSNVADGTSAVIAANRCMIFRWDSSTSKWYHA